jgi:hypothetical protein
VTLEFTRVSIIDFDRYDSHLAHPWGHESPKKEKKREGERKN